ncbi:thiolase family protein [uncultured Sneathiella sp.]|uniref:thiolase family protein n=1 Tax=uncultured Sneathiella sp. TaxID=879315 RepID=UPI0030EDDC62|tara:strand:- start:21614 stop:22732 length:1119 start_codon:yes stop_codon:yes gene_type:complete
MGWNLGVSTEQLYLQAIKIALNDAELTKEDIDGFSGKWTAPGGTQLHPGSADWGTLLGQPLSWIGDTYPQGPPGLMDAAAAVSAGACNVAVVVSGQGALGDGLAEYTTPKNEFVAPYGAFTAANFSLVAKRYMHELGPKQGEAVRNDVAKIAATIRNGGSQNPEAVLKNRGEITQEMVLKSKPVALPLRLYDICLANEGATAIIVASKSVAMECPDPVEILGVGCEWQRQQYTMAPRFEENWSVGRDAAAKAFRTANLKPEDIDVRSFYDATSFEVARQFEILGYCGLGEGAAFAVENGIDAKGKFPTNTDGGLLSYSHTGFGGPHTRASYAIRQIRGTAGSGQVDNVKTALSCGAGSGAQYHGTIIFGRPQ